MGWVVNPYGQPDRKKTVFLWPPLGKLAKQIFGKSWEFGPTGLTPAPLPIRWDSQKGKQIDVYFEF